MSWFEIEIIYDQMILQCFLVKGFVVPDKPSQFQNIDRNHNYV